VHNDRLVDALIREAQGALVSSPGARRYYDELRGRSYTTLLDATSSSGELDL
jgi:hypothetical protein